MNIEFNPEPHEYFINGIKVPHPTGILEEIGLTDFSGIPPERLKIAQEFGTAVHFASELWDKKILNESILDPKLVPYLAGWKKFLIDTGFEIELIEAVMGSEKYMFATKIDRRGILFGKRTIIEIKSTHALNIKAARIQTGFHSIANNEMYKDKKVLRRGAVLLKPDGNYQVEMFDKSNDMNIALSCLSIVNFKEAKV